MKKLKIAICSLLVLCSCFVFAACGDVYAEELENFNANLFEIGKTEFVYDEQAHVFEVEYEDVELTVTYSLDNTNFESAAELNLVNAGEYEVYYKVSADGYNDYVSANAVTVKIVPNVVELKVGNSYTYYSTLDAAVAAAGDTAEFKLYDNLVSPGVVVESGKNFVFDLNGYTFTPNVPVGSPNTITLGFQLLKDSNNLIKNGRIEAGQPGIKMLVQNYSNLTLENVTLDGRGLIGTGANKTGANYVLSNNSGVTTLKGNTNIIADDEDFAFDVYYYYPYYTSVEVVIDETFSGKIEGFVEVSTTAAGSETFAENAKLTIEDCNGNFSNTVFKLEEYALAVIEVPADKELAEYEDTGCYLLVDAE